MWRNFFDATAARLSVVGADAVPAESFLIGRYERVGGNSCAKAVLKSLYQTISTFKTTKVRMRYCTYVYIGLRLSLSARVCEIVIDDALQSRAAQRNCYLNVNIGCFGKCTPQQHNTTQLLERGIDGY